MGAFLNNNMVAIVGNYKTPKEWCYAPARCCGVPWRDQIRYMIRYNSDSFPILARSDLILKKK